MQIGDKSKVGFSIGGLFSKDLRVVDIFIGGVLITYYDHHAYVPQFIYALEHEVAFLESGKVDHGYYFMDWGPTTDDGYVRGIFEGTYLTLVCRLKNGEKAIAEAPISYLIDTYNKVIAELRRLHA
jgi:hypothetical protein